MPKMPKISKKGCRKKGHDFERWTVLQIISICPAAKRHLEYQKGEANGVDLDNTGPFLIQCKRGRKYASLSAIEEIKIPAGKKFKGRDFIPVLVTRGDDKPALACLPFKDFLELARKSKLYEKLEGKCSAACE